MAGKAQIRILPIVLNTKERWDDEKDSAGFSEILAPVHALLNTRSEKGHSGNRTRETGALCELRGLRLTERRGPFHHSRRTEARLRARMEHLASQSRRDPEPARNSDDCNLPSTPDALRLSEDQWEWRRQARRNIPNNCAIKALVEGLRPGTSQAQQSVDAR